MLDRNASGGFLPAGMGDLYRVARRRELEVCIFPVFVNNPRFCTINGAILAKNGRFGLLQFSEIAFLAPVEQAGEDARLYVGWWRVGTYQSRTHAAVGAWIGEQFLLGLLSHFAPIFPVAFWAHVGGFALGVVAAAMYGSLAPAPVERTRRGRKRLDGDFADLDDGKDPFKSELTILNLKDPK
jgi:hypothetical protein